MIGPRPATIEHFTHPGHQLSEYDDDQHGYLCSGCKTPGIGKRYRCKGGCNFDLHEYCAQCPPNLSLSFMHPHPLTLVVRKPQSSRQNGRFCNVCLESVEGLFYRCKVCDFDLHPICTQLPESVTHVLHRVHPLKLEAPPFLSTCANCRGVCDSWRYRCGLCRFDMHLQCLLEACEQSSHEGATQSGRGAPAPPPPPPHAYYHVHGGSASYAYGYPVGPAPYPVYHPGIDAPPQAGGGDRGSGGGGGGAARKGGLGKMMFKIVGRLGFSLVSNLVLGVDISSFILRN